MDFAIALIGVQIPYRISYYSFSLKKENYICNNVIDDNDVINGKLSRASECLISPPEFNYIINNNNNINNTIDF